MKLAAGAHLGPYEIVGPLGHGGMGDVYRAIDTRLDRTVAIKVLSAHAAGSPAHHQRFEREARAISSLNHPHICTLYDIGEQDGAPYLVLEYVEGETLALRLLRGALPIDEMFRCAVEIADALEHAHRQGIVHRDLKPANIMLTRTGVKLLDFGVAKLLEPSPADAGSLAATRTIDTLTEEGTILGTLQYMAPEQLQQKPVDARADLFAFGAIVYEMVAGRRAFDGGDRATVIATILTAEPPPLSAVEPLASPALERLVKKCLAKNADYRWQTARDLLDELTWIADSTVRAPSSIAAGVRAIRPRRARVAWIAAAAVVVLAGLAGLAMFFSASRRLEIVPQTFRFIVSPPEGSTFSLSHAFMTVSPDGRFVAFTASSKQGNLALWLRPLDAQAARQLPGIDGGAAQPFWSWDSRSVAFVAPMSPGQNVLKRIDITGGLPQTITETVALQSGAWNRDGVIVFRPTSGREGLYAISSAGGMAKPATALDESQGETSHNWPQFLPDGRHFLYIARSSHAEHDGVLYVGSLDSKIRVRLFATDSHVAYAPPGYLLHLRGNTLVAQPFDADSLRVTGEPLAIAEHVDRNPGSHRGAFSASQNGVPVIAYRPVGETELVWFDRGGRRLATIGMPGYYTNPALSPDEQSLAVARFDPETGAPDIWQIELARGLASRVTVNPLPDDMPLWSRDGRRILFRSRRSGSPEGAPLGFYQRASNGTGADELVLPNVRPSSMPLGWSEDGRFLLYSTLAEVARTEFSLLPMDGDPKPVRLSQSAFSEMQGKLSADGRWLAYVANESGQNEVYVRPFPSGEGRWRISIAGGIEPSWRRDGKELFYLAADRSLMAVAMKLGTTVEAGQPMRLFETSMSNLAYMTRNQYVISGDGQRFLINQPADRASAAPITVVVNWTAALEK